MKPWIKYALVGLAMGLIYMLYSLNSTLICISNGVISSPNDPNSECLTELQILYTYPNTIFVSEVVGRILIFGIMGGFIGYIIPKFKKNDKNNN